MVKNPPANAGDTGEAGLIPVRKIPWRRKQQPTPVFCLESPMDRGAWWATVHRVAKSQTLNDWAHTHHISSDVFRVEVWLCASTRVCVCASMRWNLLEQLPTQGKSLSQPSARSMLPATIYMTASWFFKHLVPAPMSIRTWWFSLTWTLLSRYLDSFLFICIQFARGKAKLCDKLPLSHLGYFSSLGQ